MQDAVELTRACGADVSLRRILSNVVHNPSFKIVVLFRLRRVANRWHIPVVPRLLRAAQVIAYGIEIDKNVQLGHGVYFTHFLGTVIGGDAKIGDRVKFMGNNTVGTAKDNGCPVIEDDVVVGCGARVLGPVRVGAGAVIGANAVVIRDVPSGAVAVGVPAKVLHHKVTPIDARRHAAH